MSGDFDRPASLLHFAVMSAPVTLAVTPAVDFDVDPRRMARQARLRYIGDSVEGFGRRRCGKGFVYLDVAGRPLKEKDQLARIQALAIPPAWDDVWICPSSDGHLQATGRDEKGRKQYRYHDRWSQAANWSKFALLRSFGHQLPRIRRRLRRDLASDDDRTRTLALMAALLDATAIRVGGREYAEENNHYGLTTLLDEHVTIEGDRVRFEFIGKSGKERNVELKDRRLAGQVARILRRKGQRLFEIRADDGSLAPAEAEHLNGYLREFVPAGCSAKTFRTWRGTVAAFEVLAAACEREAPATTKDAEKTIREAVAAAADLLGNTMTVCKAYYVHPVLCDLYAGLSFATHLRRLRPKPRAGLKVAEQRLLALLDRLDRNRL